LWRSFSAGEDALRQRITFALSEIFVISFQSGPLFAYMNRGPVSYVDMLGRNAFGNYRQMLEDVALHPCMGVYLSHMKNRKEDGKGRVPDENFAREIMQLFSIGLYKLDAQGTTITDPVTKKPVETYTVDDVTGLAKVFTGFAWAGPDTSDKRWSYGYLGPYEGRQVESMQNYPQYHSTSEKRFLGVTIPASSRPDGMGDLKIALDTLFNHPNVGPFIGKQLIQRLVSSNPSREYVGRVAAAFANNGAGVRGDMKAVIKAVLLDPEARNLASAPPNAGKLREPVVRLVQWMRAFNAKSASGRYILGRMSDADDELGQSPLDSPSVFNFFMPGYMPPESSKAGQLNLLSPEAQISNETTVAGYLNFMRGVLTDGLGDYADKDIQADYSAQLALAGDPDKLVDSLNLLLTANQLSIATRNLIRDAVGTIPIGASTAAADRLNRVRLAIFMTMASPNYLVQK
jgi:uncharacterized protein (DUF1800 family)